MSIKYCKKKVKAILGGALAIVIIASPLQRLNLNANTSSGLDSNEFKYFEDNFNRTDRDINGDNGWISVPRSTDKSHAIENGALKAEDFKYYDTYSGNGACTAVTKRPASEAAVNQLISVDILNLNNLTNYATANLHLRVMPSAGTNSAGLVKPSDSYYLAVSKDSLQIRRTYGETVTTYAVADAVTYSYISGHSYRAQFTAQGTNPTVLTACLYDITDGITVAAETTAEDYTAQLQNSGTAGLSSTRSGDDETLGRYYALFDNFKYEQTYFINFEDDFSRSGNLGNGWVSGSKAAGTMSDGTLNIKTVNYTPESDRNPWVEDSAYVRPISEKELNQQIEVEFSRGADSSAKGDMGAVIAARAQNEILTCANCYRVCAVLGWNGATNWNGRILVYSGTNELVNTQAGGLNPNGRYRLKLNVTSISASETQLDIELYLYDSENNSWTRKYQKQLTDTNPDLQNPGTAGFSIYDKWRGSINIYNFKYVSPINTFKYIESEDENVYKHLYKTEMTGGFIGNCVERVNGAACPSDTELTSFLNQTGAYIAYAVNVESAGNYPIRPLFKLSGADETAFDSYYAENNEYPYIMAVANGKSYKFNYSVSQGTFSAASELPVELNAGINIIYFMGTTAELTAKLPGITVEYNLLYIPNEGETVKVEFIAAGDINSDRNIDVRDLVRLKRFLANEEGITVNYEALKALNTGNSGEIFNSGDLAIMKQYLLNLGVSNDKFNDATWLTAVKARSVNPLSVLTEEHGGADIAAAELKKNILNAENNITVSGNGTAYYISSLNGDDSNDGKSPSGAWKSLEKLRSYEENLKAGDAVFFERGSVFRQENKVYTEHWRNYGISAVSGVSYGAYGTGNKPEFYGSSFNYAENIWEPESENIWKTQLPLQDAGIIVFDGGSSVGIKKSSLDALSNGNEFFHDTDNGILYLYCKEGSPSEIFNDIEIGCDRQFISFRNGVNNVNIDNLSIKYVGAHAVNGYENNHHINITGCEISFVGGSYYNSNVVRYGNAIQFWDRCYNININNCWVHQIYDAGLTFQGSHGTQYDDIYFENNLIQYCNYSIEFFIKDTNGQIDDGALNSIHLNNNICQFAGYGLTRQREAGSVNRAAHIAAWATDVGGNVTDFQIKNNIFDISAYNITRWIFASVSGITVQNNSYYMNSDISDYAINYAAGGQLSASNQETFEAAVATFDTQPKLVKWLEN